MLRLIYYRAKHHMKEGTTCTILDINTRSLEENLFPLAIKKAHTCKQPSVSFQTLVKTVHMYLYPKLALTQM